MKTISFRAYDDDLERINQIKETIKKENQIRTVTTSLILSLGILELWNKICLPYQDEKTYKYRAEKN